MSQEQDVSVLNKYFKIGTDGFIAVIDYMGSDEDIVRAARISYGQGTKPVSDSRTLIRYLMRHRHTTPLEMAVVKLHVRVEMDTWRQWIRHRTASCLTGDTLLHFDLPGGINRRGRQRYNLSVEDVFNRFQPTANAIPAEQRNPHFKRDRVQGMMLRCVDEVTHAPRHTRIVDIWQTGTKPTYRVEALDGSWACMSADHLCLTNQGMLPLRDAVALDTMRVKDGVLFGVLGAGRGVAIMPRFNEVDPVTETWAPIVGWEEYYEISDQGRVRRIIGGRGSRSHGRCKAVTVSYAHAVVSLNRPGEQVVRLVHRLMLEAFVGPPLDDEIACHRDGNGLNNVLDNVYWGTHADNGADARRLGTTCKTRCNFLPVTVSYVGERMTYDIEVEGPHHNFSAGGLIVHNCNEYSTRYSEAIDAVAVTPEDSWRLQSGTNKQGSSGLLGDWDALPINDATQNAYDVLRDNEEPSKVSPGAYLTRREAELHALSREVYNERLEFGVAREQARKDLPLSTYTEAIWKIDLHNLFHFLSLRMDSHAQQEIRQYADVIGRQIISKLFPLSWEAFLDYKLNAVTLSALDVAAMSAVVRTMANPDVAARGMLAVATVCSVFPGKKSRERDEFWSKFARLTDCAEKLESLIAQSNNLENIKTA